jgi:hypothetical protein
VARTDQAPLDKWTPLHLATGVGAGLVNIHPWLFVGLVVVYEVLENRENGWLRKTFFKGSEPESVDNAITDIAVSLLGYVAARRFLT